MGDWISWAIPLAALGIWILTNLAKGAEAKKQPERARPAPRPQTKSTEIDRFLQEINRRRQQQQEQERAPPVAKPVVEVPRPRPRPPQPPQPSRPRRPVATPIVVEAVPRAEPAIPIVLPVTIAERQLLESVSPIDKRDPLKAVVAAASVARTASAANLRELLRSGQGLRTAFLVSEILRPPRGLRHLRRMQ